MKYGYLFYRKPLRPEKRDRPMNMGDPIQSLAAINLYREMGIPEEDIIPVDCYNTANYDGEDVILSVNCADNFESRRYPVAFYHLRWGGGIRPVFISFHLHRQIREEEIVFIKNNEPIGCRDEFTYLFLREKGLKTYLSGCLTLTFPRREENEKQNKVFLVDCPNSLLAYIPSELRQKSIDISNAMKIKSDSKENRITMEEAEAYHQRAYEQLWRLRDEAKLVVTERLHIAVPCLAMGIPVVLAKEYDFDFRFSFIDKFLPLYTKECYHKIDWNPEPQDIEQEKALVKECFFSSVRAAAAGVQASSDSLTETKRAKVTEMYTSRRKQVEYSYGMDVALSRIPLPKDKPFRYAIWGVCQEETFPLYDEIVIKFPKAYITNLIDTYASGEALGVNIIHPDQIADLNKDVIIFVTAPSAHKPAKELLEKSGRPFVLVKNVDTEVYNYADKKN